MSTQKKLSRRDFLRLSVGAAGAMALASCSTPQPSAPTDTPEVMKAEATPVPGEPMFSTQLDKPVEFTYLRPVWGPATYEKGGSEFEKELESRANVQIEAQIVPVFDYETKLPVMAAGGQLADVSWHAGPAWGPAVDLIEQGAFLPLDDYFVRYPAVADALGETLLTLTRSPDGRNYFFPNPLAPFVPFPYVYRVDIYSELGLEPPTSITELVDQLEQIRDAKPDMVPLTLHEYSLWYFQNTGTSFGYPWGNWIPDVGESQSNPAKIVPGNVVQGYKDFLLYIQSLRKKGVIDPDYMITTGLKGIDKFNAGEAVVMEVHWGALSSINQELRKTVPEGDVSYMGQLEGADRPMGALTLTGFDRGFSIATAAEDKADDIFKFLNWAYGPGYEFMRYGVEGKTYTVSTDGIKVAIPDDDREAGWQGPNIEPFSFPPAQVDVWPKWNEMETTYAERGVPEKIGETVKMFKTAADNAMPNYNHLTVSPTASEKGAQLSEQYLTPMQEKFAIDPELSADAWDAAIANWLSNGGQQIIDEVNQIQVDKSPIKPPYEVPDEYKKYLA